MLPLMRVPVAILSVVTITIAILLGPGIVSSLGESGSPGMGCTGSKVHTASQTSFGSHRVSVPGAEQGGGRLPVEFSDFITRRLVRGEVGSGVWPGPPFPIAWKCQRLG